jgi:uncharacterized protein (TIGR03435 family)
MMPRISLGVFCLSLHLWAQSTFEVATVKQSPSISTDDLVSGRVRIGINIDAAQVNIRAASFQSILLRAFNLENYQLIAPDWMRTQPYFDIVAKIPEGVSKDRVPEMLQALLKDRFKLEVHRGTRELSVYALIIGKNGPKLKDAPPGATLTLRGGAFVNGVSHIHTVSNMDSLAFFMNTYLDRPVLDRTGLTGTYDIDLDVSRDLDSGPGPMPMLDLKSAVEPLGLKLDPRKESFEIIVVDHAEKAPTEN